MQFNRKKRSLLALVAAAALAVSAAGAPAVAQDEDVTIFFVGCAAPTGFHGYLARGAEEAGNNLGVQVNYIFPDQLTIPNQVQKIEEAIAAQADGIAVCAFAEDAAYSDVVARANELGIVVGSAAAPPSGSTVRDPEDFWLFRTGSDEAAAGALTGLKLLELGVTGSVMVGQQQPGDATCQERADAEIAVLQAAGVDAQLQELSLDLTQTAEVVTNWLRAHPDATAISSTCHIIDPFLVAAAESGIDGLMVTGYDLDATTLAAIRDGSQTFTIDQQQFWRGYMPVLLLTHQIKYGLVEGNYFLTGPALVDSSNIEATAALVEAGYR